jgi:DNA excision repair protein ERCC-3
MVLRELLRDPTIAQARVVEDVENVDEHGFITQAKAEEMKENLQMLREPDEDSEDDELDATAASRSKDTKKAAAVVVSFQVQAEEVESVKRQAIELDYPLMEEYDFKNDHINPNVPQMDLKPHTRIRRYQEREWIRFSSRWICENVKFLSNACIFTSTGSLSKMFGNGRARSGIIVLPCGAGKTYVVSFVLYANVGFLFIFCWLTDFLFRLACRLTGVTAAQTIKKSCVCLATNAVSVLQWKHQFQLWTSIPDENICVFTSDRKDTIPNDACVLVTTYTMISYSGKRADKSQEIMDAIKGREWGLLLMDEVHVVPAKMFRRVIGSVKAHCRLGLTATLVREDDLISDLK